MLEINILLNLSIKDCMFITSTIKYVEECLDLVVIGQTHWLDEAWLLVLVGHPHHPPPLALHSNWNPTRFLYFMPNPPTQPCCTRHQQFPLMPIAHILQWTFFHFQDSKRKKKLANAFVVSFILDFSLSSSMAKSTLQSRSKTLYIL